MLGSHLRPFMGSGKSVGLLLWREWSVQPPLLLNTRKTQIFIFKSGCFYLHMVIRIEVFLPCTHLKLYFPPNLLITSDIITSPQCSDLHIHLTSARFRVWSQDRKTGVKSLPNKSCRAAHGVTSCESGSSWKWLLTYNGLTPVGLFICSGGIYKMHQANILWMRDYRYIGNWCKMGNQRTSGVH